MNKDYKKTLLVRIKQLKDYVTAEVNKIEEQLLQINDTEENLLIEQAKEKYKPYCIIKNGGLSSYNQCNVVGSKQVFYFEKKYNRLWLKSVIPENSILVYDKGVWAEVMPQSLITAWTDERISFRPGTVTQDLIDKINNLLDK